MKKVAVYRETPLDSNYRPLLHLAENGLVSVEFFDHKGLEWLGIKLWYRSRIARLAVEKWMGKEPRKKEPSWVDLFNSLLHPFRLLARETIVVAFAPYSIMVFYFLLFRLLGKNVIYFTSWPYWDGQKQVHRPIPGIRKIWRLFLKNLKSVGVTRRCAEGLEKFGADSIHIPHSVNTQRFFPTESRGKSNTRILCVGRVVKEKGVQELSRVFELLGGKYPSLELVVVGDGPELGKLEGKKGISCKGHLSEEADLIGEYRASDIFVQNSYRIAGWEELFGIALIEAMACGLPCIATDCVGPKELVNDGLTGFIIPQNDERALYEKLERLILDEDLRIEFGRRGRERVRGFAVEENAAKWKDAIFL